MKKFCLFFLSIMLLGCTQFDSRKDEGSNIVFTRQIESNNIELISSTYSKNYKEKIKYYKKLDKYLQTLTNRQKDRFNMLISEDMNKDIENLLNYGLLGQELLGMKSIEDLNDTEKIKIDKLNIPTPLSGGKLQTILNKQYFLLLSLFGKTDKYNANILYTELDKTLLIKSNFLNRKRLIKNLNYIKKNFVYTFVKNTPDKPIFIDSLDADISNLKNTIIFKKSNTDTGFKVLSNSILIFVGDGEKKHYIKNYRFNANVVSFNSVEELGLKQVKSIGVYKLLGWKRVIEKENNTNKSLSENFSLWEDK